MNRTLRISAALSLLLVTELILVGCNATKSNSNTGGSGTNDTSTMPVGMYMGTGSISGNVTVNGATSNFSGSPYLLGFVTSTGNYMLLSYSTGSPNVISQIDVGTATASNGSLASSDDQNYYLFPNFSADDYPDLLSYQGSTLAATYVSNASITGTITYPGQDAVLSFPLGIIGASTQASSLSAVAGTYTGSFYSIGVAASTSFQPAASTITITPAGVLSGTVYCPFGVNNTRVSRPAASTPANCAVSGTVTARSDIDAYDVSISFVNGTTDSFPGTWVGVTATGLGYYNSTTQKFMVGTVTPGNIPFAFSN